MNGMTPSEQGSSAAAACVRMRPIRKGDAVSYKVWWGKTRIQAIVRRSHRDGSYTVEARFALNKSGEATGTYIGHKYRLRQNDIHPILHAAAAETPSA